MCAAGTWVLLHDSVSLVYLVLWVQSTLLITQQVLGVLGQGLPHLQAFGTFILRFPERGGVSWVPVGILGGCW